VNFKLASSRWWLWRIGTALAAAVILVARKPFALTLPQLWAEDAYIFFDQAGRLGASALLTPYGGYLHFGPRCVAWLGAHLDPLNVPLLYNAGAGLVAVLALSSLVSPRLGPPALGALLALGPLLLPHSGEVFLSLTNMQWFLAFAWLGALLKSPAETPRALIAESVLLGLAGLTGPFAVLLTPAFFWRAWRKRGAGTLVPALVVAATAAVQIGFLLRDPPLGAVAPPGSVILQPILHALGDRLVVQFFFAGAWRPGALPLAFLVLATAGTVGFAVFFARSRRGACAALGVIALLVTGLALWRFRSLLPLFDSLENGDRYFFLARGCLAWIFILAAWETRRHARIWLVVPALAVGATLAFNFQFRPWPNLDWPAQCEFIRRGLPARIPINGISWTYDYPGRPR
jgi:hypothetical protein